MGMLTSGQMGKANRVSEKAMRIYEKKGLLEPEHIDEETGWRYYSIEQSTKFDLILELQQVGFTLDEIVEVTKHVDVAYLREMLAAKKTQLDEQIANLIIARSVVESYVDGCDRYLYPTLTDQIMLEMMPERRVLMFKLPDELRDSHHAANNSASFETVLRFTRQSIVDGGYPPVLFRDVCSVLDAEHVSDPSAPLVTHTFVCVGDADLEGCTVLPSGPHLTLYNGEAYTEDGDSLSRARVERMVEYAGKKGLTVEGVPFGETICRWPRLFGEGSKVLHRLCVPVHR